MSPIRKFAHNMKWRFHCIFDSWQDRRLAIDASGLHEQEQLASSGPNARYSYVYLGTPHLVIDLAFRRFNVDPSRFTFVDLGSGKGRVVVRAATRPFKRVEGVELSPKMHNVALENVHNANVAGKLRSPVFVRNEDVLKYDIPETPLVLFFFNSFQRVALNKFLDKLQQSLRDRPRECYFVYVNPRNGDCVEERTLMRAVPISRLMRIIIRLLSPWPMAIYR
jgi:hypothetical protein